MDLARASWIVVIAVCVIAAIVSFIFGYAGYGFTVVAVGLAASVNLLPRSGRTSGKDSGPRA